MKKFLLLTLVFLSTLSTVDAQVLINARQRIQGGNTDQQTVTDFSISGNTLSITLERGNTATVDLPASIAGNPVTNVELSGNNLVITFSDTSTSTIALPGGSTATLQGVTDNGATTTNAITAAGITSNGNVSSVQSAGTASSLTLTSGTQSATVAVEDDQGNGEVRIIPGENPTSFLSVEQDGDVVARGNISATNLSGTNTGNQDISLSGADLTLSGGSTVTLPVSDNTITWKEVTAARDLVEDDLGKDLYYSGASDVVLTIPSGLTPATATSTTGNVAVTFYQEGSGKIQIATESGVTGTTYETSSQFKPMAYISRGANTWVTKGEFAVYTPPAAANLFTVADATNPDNEANSVSSWDGFFNSVTTDAQNGSYALLVDGRDGEFNSGSIDVTVPASATIRITLYAKVDVVRNQEFNITGLTNLTEETGTLGTTYSQFVFQGTSTGTTITIGCRANVTQAVAGDLFVDNIVVTEVN